MCASVSKELQKYPYFKSAFHCQPTEQLNDIAIDAITRAAPPIVEIGGPTERGFRLLRDLAILSETPLITDLHPRKPDVQRMDGTNTGLPERSVGMFLASHLARTDYFGLDTNGSNGAQEEWDAAALGEYDRLMDDPSYDPQYNLRLRVLGETKRVLRPSGIIIFEGISSLDIAAANVLGYGVLQTSAVSGEEYFDVVLQND